MQRESVDQRCQKTLFASLLHMLHIEHMDQWLLAQVYTQTPWLLGAKAPVRIGPDMPGSLTTQTALSAAATNTDCTKHKIRASGCMNAAVTCETVGSSASAPETLHLQTGGAKHSSGLKMQTPKSIS